MRVKAAFMKGDNQVAEAIFEVHSPGDLAAGAHWHLEEIRKVLPEISLLEADMWLKFEGAENA